MGTKCCVVLNDFIGNISNQQLASKLCNFVFHRIQQIYALKIYVYMYAYTYIYIHYIYYIHILCIMYIIFNVSVIAEEYRLSDTSLPTDTYSMISNLPVVDIIEP